MTTTFPRSIQRISTFATFASKPSETKTDLLDGAGK